ncbi:hypothetical protein R3P38DRAFT_3167082 [Favolaschia claudopus]|uniref:Uncharacterized protein n=1 Tax=Favolaschia claudopus TaxID=2862362 RepID=A0AAW0EEK3_9AGAR
MTSRFAAENSDPHPNRLKALKKHLKEMLLDPEKAQKEHDELMASLQSRPKSHPTAYDYLKRKTRAAIRREQQMRQREIRRANETTNEFEQPSIVQDITAALRLEKPILDAITDEATKTGMKDVFKWMREAKKNPPTEEEIQEHLELLKGCEGWPA